MILAKPRAIINSRKASEVVNHTRCCLSHVTRPALLEKCDIKVLKTKPNTQIREFCPEVGDPFSGVNIGIAPVEVAGSHYFVHNPIIRNSTDREKIVFAFDLH